jgi:hypothetical protein
VLTVDDRRIGDGGIGPVTARIVSAYHDVVRSQGTPIWPDAVNAVVLPDEIAVAGR